MSDLSSDKITILSVPLRNAKPQLCITPIFLIQAMPLGSGIWRGPPLHLKHFLTGMYKLFRRLLNFREVGDSVGQSAF